jgi:hypothetical protein
MGCLCLGHVHTCLFPEQSRTYFSNPFRLSSVFVGWVLSDFLSLLGSMYCLWSAYRVIGSCVIVEFLDKLVSCYFSHF